MLKVYLDQHGMIIKNQTGNRQLGGTGQFQNGQYATTSYDAPISGGGRMGVPLIVDSFATMRLKWNPTDFGWNNWSWDSEAGRDKFRKALRDWHSIYVTQGLDAANAANVGVAVAPLPKGWSR